MSGLGYASAVFFTKTLIILDVIKTKPNNCNTLPKRHKHHSLVENINCTLQIIHLSASRLDSD